MLLLDQESLRLIFGIKLRTLRQEKGFSLKTLAKASSLSPSYINEIEKGKKYPKSDKIMLLAHSLGVSYDELISIQLKKELSFLTKVLEKNLLKGLPFNIFGIPAQTVFEMMAEEPTKMSALLGTVLELSRQYDMKVEEFFYATLRAYLDMNNNYFPEIEEKVNKFKDSQKITTQDQLDKFLKKENLLKYLEKSAKYTINEVDFSSISPDIKNFHYYFNAKKNLTLTLNKKLSEREKIFILLKEIAHTQYKHKERLYTSQQKNIDSFDSIFNNFKASYFSSALLIPKEPFIKEIEGFFSQPKWEPEKLLAWIIKQPGTMQSFFHRLSQILPQFFNLEHIFFLIFKYDTQKKEFKMSRELHLSELHAPHSVKISESYCQRWITTSLLKKAHKEKKDMLIGIQRSRFFEKNNEYLNLSLAHNDELNPHIKVCVTIGILATPLLKEKIKFFSDPSIPSKTVSDTCEQCGIMDCKERVAPPKAYEEKLNEEKTVKILDSYFS